jgi:hypothetical protein
MLPLAKWCAFPYRATDAALLQRRGIACRAIKLGAVLGMRSPEIIGNAENGWAVFALVLRQADSAASAALWTTQFFVPLVSHPALWPATG